MARSIRRAISLMSFVVSPRIAHLVARSKVHLVSDLVDQAAVAEHFFNARDTSLERQEPHEARHVKCRRGEALRLDQLGQAEVVRRPRGRQRITRLPNLETATGPRLFRLWSLRWPGSWCQSGAFLHAHRCMCIPYRNTVSWSSSTYQEIDQCPMKTMILRMCKRRKR